MSRPFADQSLHSLASRLKSISFDDPSGYFAEAVKELDGTLLPRRHVFKRRGLYCVTVSYGARSFVIGVTGDARTAYRFADMSILFFWPYRQRGDREASNKHFNFSLATAKQDLLDNEAAHSLLQDLEAHFTTNYQWKTREQLTAEYELERPDILERADGRSKMAKAIEILSAQNQLLKTLSAQQQETNRQIALLRESLFVAPKTVCAGV